MSAITIRRAIAADLEPIIRIYAADTKGGHGDVWNEAARPAYERAMAAVLASPSNRLYVAVVDEHIVDTGRGPTSQGGRIVGTFQLTLTPGLVGGGRTRATAESVHVLPEHRGQGVGAQMMAHAIAEAKAAGAGVLQLSSNKSRTDAHRFYEKLGFAKSHEGFKLSLG